MATITRENIGSLHDKITVQLNQSDYLPAFEKAIKEYSKKANIPGFRPGMVPSGMIKKMYGASIFMDEVLRSVDKELVTYMDTEKLDIFAQPLPAHTPMDTIDFKNPVDYSFDFEIGLKPAFSLSNLATAPITAYNIDITEDMINSEVARLQNKHGNIVDKEAVDGDENVLNVTFTEVDESGEIVVEGIEKDNSLLLKYFTEKARAAFMGKKSGDSVIIKLGAAFDDKELEFIAQDLGLNKDDETAKAKNFKVTITKVGQLEKRALDEEFFKQLYASEELKTEADFRKKIKEEIFTYWATQSRNQIQDQLFHYLVDHTNIEFPEAFLKKWLVEQNRNADTNAPQKTEEDIEKEMPTFLKQLKWNLITENIIKDNGIQIDPEEIKAFARQQLFSYMGGSGMEMGEEQPWINDYVERMMKDRKYVEESYHRLQTEKVFGWAETQINPTPQSIAAEDFTKMVSEHQHHHH